jgi:hypothetical protein
MTIDDLGRVDVNVREPLHPYLDYTSRPFSMDGDPADERPVRAAFDYAVSFDGLYHEEALLNETACPFRSARPAGVWSDRCGCIAGAGPATATFA